MSIFNIFINVVLRKASNPAAVKSSFFIVFLFLKN